IETKDGYPLFLVTPVGHDWELPRGRLLLGLPHCGVQAELLCPFAFPVHRKTVTHDIRAIGATVVLLSASSRESLVGQIVREFEFSTNTLVPTVHSSPRFGRSTLPVSWLPLVSAAFAASSFGRDSIAPSAARRRSRR